MNTVFVVLTAVVLLLMLVFIGRVIVGPTIFDRVVALNASGTLFPILLILIGLDYDRADMFIDLALALFLLNVFTTLLIARYARHQAEVE
jgi:multicomponent Na+:H+ antiporter subunit F